MSESIKGLEGVIAAETKISSIDGVNGILTIRGYDIHDIAANSNFEEMCYLLIFGKLPTKSELKEFNKKLKENRNLPKEVLKLMKGYALNPYSPFRYVAHEKNPFFIFQN